VMRQMAPSTSTRTDGLGDVMVIKGLPELNGA
jgi:hypothetical protein